MNAKGTWKKKAVFLMSTALLLGGCSADVSEASAEKDITEVSAAGTAAEQTAGAVLPADHTSADKNESVYVTADALGNPEETEVTVVLKHTADGKAIADVSNLENIRNTEGEEQLTQNGQNLEWENLGSDITYKGDTSQETPVTVKVTYTLDGKEIAPEDLAGKSGHVTIRFDYSNHTEQKVTVDGTEYTTVVPYMAITAVLLPEDQFSNIEVENGTVMELDGEQAAAGYALPGLAGVLKLDEFEDLKDTEIPEYVEVSADCIDFELDFTATVLSSGLFEDLENGDLDDLDDLAEDFLDLGDAGDELTDGVRELLSGTGELKTYFSQYFSGVSEFGEGVLKAAEGISQLAKQEQSLSEVTAQLDSGLAALNTSISSMDSSSVSSLSDAGTALVKDTAALQQILMDLQTVVTGMQDYLTAVQSYEAEVAKAADLLNRTDVSGLNAQAQQQASDAIAEAVKDMDLSEEQKQQLLDAAGKIDLSDSTNAISQAKEILNTLKAPEMPQITIDASAVSAAVQAVQTDLQKLGNAGESLAGLSAGLAALQQNLPLLSQAASGVNQGTKTIAGYLNTAADSMSAMKDAVSSLNTYGGSLSDGLGTLTSGISEMYSGVQEFDEDGLQKLSDLGGSDLQKLIGRIRALKEADSKVSSFTGNVQGMETKTSYIIETAEIRS